MVLRFWTRIIFFLYQDRVEETTVRVGGELLTDKSDGDLAAVVPELNKLVPELVKRRLPQTFVTVTRIC